MTADHPADLAGHLEAFFLERLGRERGVSPHTVAAYRDAFRLLLAFAEQCLGRLPSALAIDDLDALFIKAFLDHLEAARGNSVRTRNARLAAMHSFFRYVALREPRHGAIAQRVLALPLKRTERPLVPHLTAPEVTALLAAPDLCTWGGRRDRALLLLAVQGGLRVSELTGLRVEDCVLGPGAHVRCRGKGRKERCTPLRREAARVLRAWLHERSGSPTDLLFPSARGRRLSRDGVAYILTHHIGNAALTQPSLRSKHITPHVLRHTTAMTLLQNGVDRTVIAPWLGHESVETTEVYVHADLQMKQRALDHATPTPLQGARYRPPDRLLKFLEGL